MRKILFLVIVLLPSTILFAQEKIYLGIEGGISSDKYELFDPGGELLSTSLKSGSGGFSFSYDLNDYFTVETGIILKWYAKGFAFAHIGREVGFTNGGINAFQIPFRLRSRLPIVRDKFYFSTVLGFHHCVNGFQGNSAGYYGVSGGTFNLDAEEVFSGGFVNSFPLLETGVGLELKVLKSSFLRFSASYFTGFKTVAQSNIVYTVNDGPQSFAELRSKGDYASYNLGIRIPIIKLNTQKK